MKTVAYSCAFAPCELIAACGLRPARIAPELGPLGAADRAKRICRDIRRFRAEAVEVPPLSDGMRPTLRTRLQALLETAKDRRRG